MTLEAKIKKFKSTLAVKQLMIDDKIHLAGLLKDEGCDGLACEFQEEVKVILREYNSVCEEYLVLLLDNAPREDVNETVEGVKACKSTYEMKVLKCRNEISKLIKASPNFQSVASPPVNKCNLKLPELKLTSFSDNSSDPFAFDSFRTSFINVMSSFSDISNIEKMIYLKSALKGRALVLIENIPINESSFDDAWKLLEEELFDRDFLVNSVISKILDYENCNDLNACVEFSSYLKSKLLNLKKMNYDFREDASAGNLLLSHIVRSKLPSFFLQELCRRSNVGFPTVNQFIDLGSEIFKMFKKSNVTSKAKMSYNVSSVRPKTFFNKNSDDSHKVEITKESVKSESKNSNSNYVKSCKLCLSASHSTLHCKKFINYTDRIRRADELFLCTKCLSKAHKVEACPGRKGNLPFSCASCKQSDHVTPLCPTMVLSLSAAKQSNKKD